jgi:MFS family permease
MPHLTFGAAMSTRTPNTSRVALGAWGLFSGLLLMMLSNGLLASLVGLRAELEMFSTTATGIVMAFYYVGFLGGSRLVPTFVGNVGHIRVFAALASLASVSALVHVLDVTPATWSAMRFITGFSYAGLYITAESWLNDSATNENRGTLLSVYMVTIMGGMMLSQGLLIVASAEEVTLFVLASVLVSVAVVPVTLSVGAAPEFRFQTRLAMREIWTAAPLGVVTGAGVGLANGALWGLGAVYAARAGMTTNRIALFMGAAVAGSLVTQIPLGRWSDRVRRRRAILAVTAAAAGAAAIAGLTDPLSPLMIVVVFVFGGVSFPMYSLGLSHINDHVPYGASVSVSSLYVFVNGVFAIGGPILGAFSIDRAGPEGLFWLMAAVHALIGVFAVVRILASEGLPVDRQRKFTMVPARGNAVVIQLASKVRRNGKD